MKGRRVHWLLVLYPRAWRGRYGSEVACLNDELIGAGETTALRAGLDLVAGAATEWARALSQGAVLVSAAGAAAAAAGIVLAVTHAPGGGFVGPYFSTHPVGLLLFFAVLSWLMLEFVAFLQVQQRPPAPEGATRAGTSPAFWASLAACVAGANVWLYLAPRIAPAAAIRPAPLAFALGMVVFVAGVGLRGWTFKALGPSFTFGIVVCPGQPVVTAGPYRLVRHPAFAGSMLISAGVGAMSANWAGLAAMTGLSLISTLWRILTEEKALLATLGDAYRCYAAGHHRLVPFIW